MKNQNFLTADLHTPEELLAGAESLLLSSDPQIMRAVVLESFTSLEVFVHNTVFVILKEKINPLLVRWLEYNSRSRFDDRLSIFTPVALDQPIDKNSELWNDYKKAQIIRNGTTHSSKKVSFDEAKFVVRTVYKWLAFLGSTAEVDLALLGLKKYIERTNIEIKQELDAIKIVKKYFAKTKAVANNDIEIRLSHGKKADLILKFGENTVLIETKFTRGNIVQFKSSRQRTIIRTKGMLKSKKVTRAIIIIFHHGRLPEFYEKIEVLDKDKISIVGILVK